MPSDAHAKPAALRSAPDSRRSIASTRASRSSTDNPNARGSSLLTSDLSDWTSGDVRGDLRHHVPEVLLQFAAAGMRPRAASLESVAQHFELFDLAVETRQTSGR